MRLSVFTIVQSTLSFSIRLERKCEELAVVTVETAVMMSSINVMMWANNHIKLGNLKRLGQEKGIKRRGLRNLITMFFSIL